MKDRKAAGKMEEGGAGEGAEGKKRGRMAEASTGTEERKRSGKGQKERNIRRTP